MSTKRLEVEDYGRIIKYKFSQGMSRIESGKKVTLEDLHRINLFTSGIALGQKESGFEVPEHIWFLISKDNCDKLMERDY
jgi:hypothetical protein